ncbi:hypothetical protein [Alistipes indistinctus]|uniref:hypothetical protein n=1 Tax=Alistipes indistinctus TaxID=626932 RepID=UPI002068E434|nr:MAG TPA: hypothetical protein [Caudoviricetes sp.]
MTVEEFINKELCPRGVVTVWEETLITTAYQLGDLPKILETLYDLCEKAGIEMPMNLTLN